MIDMALPLAVSGPRPRHGAQAAQACVSHPEVLKVRNHGIGTK